MCQRETFKVEQRGHLNAGSGERTTALEGAESVNPSEENGNGFVLTGLLWNNEQPVKVVLVGARPKASVLLNK